MDISDYNEICVVAANRDVFLFWHTKILQEPSFDFIKRMSLTKQQFVLKTLTYVWGEHLTQGRCSSPILLVEGWERNSYINAMHIEALIHQGWEVYKSV